MSSPKFSIGSIYNETNDEEYASSKDGINPMQNPFVNGELITVFESGVNKKMRYENKSFYISYGLKTYILEFEVLLDFQRNGDTVTIYSEDITIIIKASIDDSRAIEYLMCKWFEHT